MSKIRRWLESQDMAQYADAFEDNDIDIDLLPDLNDQALKDLGVASVGHRLRLLSAIKAGVQITTTPSAPPAGAALAEPQNEGERRHATVLFSDLTGYTAMNERLDPEVVGEIMAGIKAEAVRIVERHGGIVNQFVGDEILALFGIPITHEDDPVRAIRTALALHAMVRRMSENVEARIGQPLRLHTGIDSGLVVTNSRDARDGAYGITGDTVNIGARLAASCAVDQIWVSPQTHLLVADYFEAQAQEPVNLKGKTAPMVPYRIVGATPTETRFEAARRRGLSAYTGRGTELALMRSSLEDVMSGKGQLVAVVGEAGAGKSRLLFEFRSGLDRNRVGIVEGRCQSYGAETPYLPFLDALRRALNLRDEDSPEQLHDKVITQVSAIDASLDRFVPHYLHLLSIASTQHALPAQLQGAERRRAFEEALVALFTLSAKRQPRLVILEDWHWADVTSDAVLKHLAGLVPQYPIMIVLLCRPEYDLKWAAAGQVTQVALKPLSVADTGALVCTALGVSTLPEALKTLIHQRTGGNPLFIEEVCHALVEERILTVQDNHATLTRGIETVQLPDTVQAVIRSRVDRLDKTTQEVLQLASVIGREFARALLEKIPTRAKHLGETLETLRAHDLIRQVRVVPEAEYVFKHVLTQIVVYETLLHIRRKALHELVGKAIEEVYAERIEEHYESLAYHYQRSDNAQKAIRYLELAGDKAKAQYVLQQTVKNYVQAIELIQTQDKSPEMMRDHIDVAVKWADLIVPSSEVIVALRTAQSYAERLQDNDLLAKATSFLGQLLLYMGEPDAAIPELRRVIDMAGLLQIKTGLVAATDA